MSRADIYGGAIKMCIQNFDKLVADLPAGQAGLRRAALEIAEAGLESIDTEKAVKRGVVLDGEILKVKGKEFDLVDFERVFVVAVGKCALEAGRALEDILGDRLTGGIVLDIRPGKLKKIKTFAGTHPYPSEENMAATAKIIKLLSSLTKKDFVIFVISGGGSALLCQPKGMSFENEKSIVKCLFRAGADIKELNIVRKHLSLARGGYLAKYSCLATSIAMIFSDVPGGDIEFISSGPTVKDITTIKDTRRILDKYEVEKITGLNIKPIETPKEEECFKNVTNILFLDNVAVDAMAKKAESLGFKAIIKTKTLSGEAREVGKQIGGDLNEAGAKTALLYGGETTVTVKGSGKGGRNEELILGALKGVQEGQVVLSINSDGQDNTDFAGALCDKITKERVAKLGLKPEIFLENNDSYHFFEKAGDYIMTGDTGSNVSDLIIAIKN